MKKQSFEILYALLKSKCKLTQRDLAQELGVSLGTVNSTLKELVGNELVDETGVITEAGKKALDGYKVDNAIIMAAGMSSRFAPLSYECPKGLLNVKGEVLIERQIRQLHEAGIQDITLVLGYMKEKFFYLEEKFGVNIVINEDYHRYNNTSTLIRVLDQLKNTYICSSDNYFVENVFEPYVYQAYYAAVYAEGETNEYCMTTDNKGRITAVNPEGGRDSWFMLGHVYFSKEFSAQFATILEKEYSKAETKEQLWECLYIKHINELDLYIKKYEADQVLEFDSLDELRSFDEQYINNTNSKILKNIGEVLHCEDKDVQDIIAIKTGLTNTSFSFTCKGKKYVYRHPGVGTDEYINRESEAFSMKVAKELELDDTFIYMNAEEGWKISYFIEDARTLDYHKEEEVREALSMVKKLHDANIKSSSDFNIWKGTQDFIKKIEKHGRSQFEDFNKLYTDMERLYNLTEEDHVEKRLCHCDCYDPNFLIGKDNKMFLIDWEYSGNDDPANDLGTFICCSDYTYEEALEIFKIYFGRELTRDELKHHLAYVAIASYYWYVWAIYQDTIGNSVGEYLYIWYKAAKFYLEKAMELYTTLVME